MNFSVIFIFRQKRKRNDNHLNDDNIENEYEKELLEEEEPKGKKTRRLLPIKTDGKIIHRVGFVEEDCEFIFYIKIFISYSLLFVEVN